MAIELPVGFIYRGKKVKECEVRRRPTVGDRVRAVQFSKSKFGEEVEDAIACYLLSELCEFSGEKLPAEFLIDNLDYEDFLAIWSELVKFRPSSEGSQEDSELSAKQGGTLQGDKADDGGAGS